MNLFLISSDVADSLIIVLTSLPVFPGVVGDVRSAITCIYIYHILILSPPDWSSLALL